MNTLNVNLLMHRRTYFGRKTVLSGLNSEINKKGKLESQKVLCFVDDTTLQENAFKKVNQHEKEMTEIIKKALAHIELRNVSVDFRKAHQSSYK